MAKSDETQRGRITLTKDGPYLVTGGLPLSKEIMVPDAKGDPVAWRTGECYPENETYALCRCGKSKNKPYCDGAHTREKFDGTETADGEGYLKKPDLTEGPELVLQDVEALCANARFCHPGGGIWALVEGSGDPEKSQQAVQEACDCPSGRLAIREKQGRKPIEPAHRPSICLIEDPGKGVSGPIWVRGGVPVVSCDGRQYAARNRVTLCRCGKSGNKPFCDGRHIRARFNDGDESLK